MNEIEKRIAATLESERQAVTARMRQGVAGSAETSALPAQHTSGRAADRARQRWFGPMLAAACAVFVLGLVGIAVVRGGDDGASELNVGAQVTDQTPPATTMPITSEPVEPAEDALPAQPADPAVADPAVDPLPTVVQPTPTPTQSAETSTPEPQPTQPNIVAVPAEPTPATQPAASEEPTPTVAPTDLPEPTATSTPEPTATPEPTVAVGDVPAISRSRDFAYLLRPTTSGHMQLFDGPAGVPYDATYQWPDGTSIANPVTDPTAFNNPLVLQVLRGQPGDSWAEVLISTRPNGTTAWVNTAGFEWSETTTRITVSLSNFSLQVFQSGAPVLDTRVVIGRADRPTPLASMAYVDEILEMGSGSRGPYFLSLTIYTDDAPGVNGGGIPKVAIQGSSNAEQLAGQATTFGSILVSQPVVTELASLVPQGAIVEIVP